MPGSPLERDWVKIVAGLDRHRFRRHGSPDRAGLADLMRLYGVSGVSIAVEQEGAVPWTAGFGTTAVDEPRPISPRTVFQACSISKHVAAFGALRLVDAGVIGLDEDIAAHLTSWRLPSSDGWTAVVTLRQLLAHTAGLSYTWFRGYRTGRPVPTVPQVLAGQVPATTPPVRVSTLPGSRFRYSGSHYAVLQQLMEDSTGEPFPQLMRDLVLTPIGMADSSYDQAFPHSRQVAVGHNVDGTPVAGRWRVQPELAGAGLWTTSSDLTRLGQEINRAAGGRSTLLPRHLAEQMLTPQVPGGYGLGTEINDTGDRMMFGHSGRNIGYSCWTYTWPGTATTVTVMTNNEDCLEILDSLLMAADSQHGTHNQAPLLPSQVAGTYQLRDDYTVTIHTTDDDTLVLTAPHQRPITLHALPDGRFHAPGLDCDLSFHQSDDDVTTLRIRQEGSTQNAVRQPDE